MAISYVNVTGAMKGITSSDGATLITDAGLNIESIDADYDNPKSYLMNSIGGRRGFTTNYDPSITVAIKGETLGTGGLMGSTFVTAMTVAFLTNYPLYGFGITAGAIYLDKAKVSAGREAWRTAELNATILPLITT